MFYLKGDNRYQTSFIINCIDDFIDENNSVRAIDKFVNMLHLKELAFIMYNSIHLILFYKKNAIARQSDV